MTDVLEAIANWLSLPATSVRSSADGSRYLASGWNSDTGSHPFVIRLDHDPDHFLLVAPFLAAHMPMPDDQLVGLLTVLADANCRAPWGSWALAPTASRVTFPVVYRVTFLLGDPEAEAAQSRDQVVRLVGSTVALVEAVCLRLLEWSGAPHASLHDRPEERLAIAEVASDDRRAADALFELGREALKLGLVNEADEYLTSARDRYEAGGDQIGFANATFALGKTAHFSDRLDDAEALLTSALSQYRTLNMAAAAAGALRGLGDLALRRDRLDEAGVALGGALRWYDENEPDGVGGAETALVLGELLNRRGNRSQAESLYRKALVRFEAHGDAIGVANATLRLGELARHRELLAEAERLLRDALGRYEAGHEPLGAANARLMLGELAARSGRLADARTLLVDAMNSYVLTADRSGIANATLLLGMLAHDRGELDEAEKLINEALGHFETIERELGAATARRALGELALQRGNLDEADAHLRFALPRLEAITDGDGVASVLVGLGEVCVRRQRLDEAEVLLRAAGERCIHPDTAVAAVGALVWLGETALLRDQQDQAGAYFRDAYGRYAFINTEVGIANAAFAIGKAQLWAGRFDEAEELFSQAARAYAAVGNASGAARVAFGLGELGRLAGRHADARRYLDDAVARFVQTHDALGIANTSLSLALLALAQHCPDEALSHFIDAAAQYAKVDDPNEAHVLAQIARFYLQRADPAAALDPARRAVERLERLRGSLRSLVTRSETGARWEEVYEIAVRSLLVAAAAAPGQGDALTREALAMACLYQGRLLHEELVTAHRLPKGDPWAYLAPDEAAEAGTIEGRLDTAQAAYDALLERTRRELAEQGVSPNDLEHSARRELAGRPEAAELLAAMSERRRMLERALLRASADRDPVLPEIDLGAIEAALRAQDAVLIDLVWGPGLHVGFVLWPDGKLSVCDFDADPSALAAIEAAREGLSSFLADKHDGPHFDADAFTTATATLAERLWRPLAGSLGTTALRLVLPAALGAVPFATLARRIGGGPLRLLPGPALLVSRRAV